MTFEEFKMEALKTRASEDFDEKMAVSLCEKYASSNHSPHTLNWYSRVFEGIRFFEGIARLLKNGYYKE